MLWMWIRAHFQELLHQILLWHWAYFTLRHAYEFTFASVEHSVHLTMMVLWAWAIVTHFRRRLCNKKLSKSEV